MMENLSQDVFETILNTLPEGRNPDWPHILCRISRLIHIAVWDEGTDFISTQKVIGLLNKAKDQMCAFDTSVYDEDEQKRIKKHIRNVTWRIKNIEDNYMQGKLSDFAPDDKLDD